MIATEVPATASVVPSVALTGGNTMSIQWIARHAEGDRCTRATATRDCPRNHDYSRSNWGVPPVALMGVSAILTITPTIQAARDAYAAYLACRAEAVSRGLIGVGVESYCEDARAILEFTTAAAMAEMGA